MSEPTREALRPINPRSYGFVRLALRLVFDGYFHTHVSGRENLPPPGTPVIVAANHASNLDVFAAGHALARPGYFLSKVEATRLPLFGRLLLSVGAIPANRDRRDTQALRLMTAALEAGNLLGVAPEGTRSPDGTLRAFDPGFIWLAMRTGAQVVPIAIHGTHALLPKGARWPRRGDLWICFGAPMAVGGGARPGRGEIEARAGEVRACVLGMLAALAAESGVSNPAVEAAASEASTAAAEADSSDAAQSAVEATVPGSIDPTAMRGP